MSVITIRLKDIDWKELREQKAIFVRMIQDWDEADDIDQRNEAEKVEGILELVHSIQEYAVDFVGVPEEEVFGTLT